MSRADPSLWLSDRPVTVAVAGVSMAPFLLEGDHVDVLLAEPRAFHCGDLIVFLRAGDVVVHRFLANRDGRFLEKGDAQARGNWAEWPADVGRVVARRRGESRLDLMAPPWPSRMARQGRGHLRAHRLAVFADKVPGGLPRRTLLRLGRLAACFRVRSEE